MLLVIDSTEYKQDRTLNKRDFAVIRDFGKHGFIKLHIPYMVYMEVYSMIVDDLTVSINQIKNELLGLEKKGILASDYLTAKTVSKSVEDFLPNIENSVTKLWDSFIKESKAIKHPLYEADSTPVFEAYFTGKKPFKSLKSRKDIPDAFIYETIIRLVKEEDVHVVSGDAGMRTSFDGISKIKTYSSLKEFLSSVEFETLVKKRDAIMFAHSKQQVLTAEIESGKDLLMEFKDVFETAVENYVSNVHYLEIDETYLPSDNGEATIQAIDDFEVILDRQKIEFINDSYYVPILVKAVASVDFYVEKSEYWSRNNLRGSEWNEWVYLCEDTFSIELEKTIIISKDEFNEDLEPEIEIDDFDEIRLITPFDRDREDFEF
nr:PIN domain-containing protein [uncultured Flavobacterium sp.]